MGHDIWAVGWITACQKSAAARYASEQQSVNKRVVHVPGCSPSGRVVDRHVRAQEETGSKAEGTQWRYSSQMCVQPWIARSWKYVTKQEQSEKWWFDKEAFIFSKLPVGTDSLHQLALSVSFSVVSGSALVLFRLTYVHYKSNAQQSITLKTAWPSSACIFPWLRCHRKQLLRNSAGSVKHARLFYWIFSRNLLALRWAGDLSRVWPAYRPMAAGWMDGWKEIFSINPIIYWLIAQENRPGKQMTQTIN